MSNANAPNRAQDVLIAGLGLIGVLISWVYFTHSTFEYGYVESWVAAFQSHPFSVGLHWDLVLSDVIILTIAFLERERLGTRAFLLMLPMCFVFGVCAAIPTYWIARRRADARMQNP